MEPSRMRYCNTVLWKMTALPEYGGPSRSYDNLIGVIMLLKLHKICSIE